MEVPPNGKKTTTATAVVALVFLIGLEGSLLGCVDTVFGRDSLNLGQAFLGTSVCANLVNDLAVSVPSIMEDDCDDETTTLADLAQKKESLTRIGMPHSAAVSSVHVSQNRVKIQISRKIRGIGCVTRGLARARVSRNLAHIFSCISVDGFPEYRIDIRLRESRKSCCSLL